MSPYSVVKGGFINPGYIDYYNKYFDGYNTAKELDEGIVITPDSNPDNPENIVAIRNKKDQPYAFFDIYEENGVPYVGINSSKRWRVDEYGIPTNDVFFQHEIIPKKYIDYSKNPNDLHYVPVTDEYIKYLQNKYGKYDSRFKTAVPESYNFLWDDSFVSPRFFKSNNIATHVYNNTSMPTGYSLELKKEY